MATRRVTITVADGLHARPVAELARIAMAHSAPVTLQTSSGVVVDASSVLAVMDLGLDSGDEVTLATAEHPAADDVFDALAAVLNPPDVAGTPQPSMTATSSSSIPSNVAPRRTMR